MPPGILRGWRQKSCVGLYSRQLHRPQVPFLFQALELESSGSKTYSNHYIASSSLVKVSPIYLNQLTPYVCNTLNWHAAKDNTSLSPTHHIVVLKPRVRPDCPKCAVDNRNAGYFLPDNIQPCEDLILAVINSYRF